MCGLKRKNDSTLAGQRLKKNFRKHFLKFPASLDTKQKAVFGLVWSEYEKLAAKERQVRKPSDSVQETFPEQNGQSRDKAGERVGVSGKSKLVALKEHSGNVSGKSGDSRDKAGERRASDRTFWVGTSASLLNPVRSKKACFLYRKSVCSEFPNSPEWAFSNANSISVRLLRWQGTGLRSGHLRQIPN